VCAVRQPLPENLTCIQICLEIRLQLPVIHLAPLERWQKWSCQGFQNLIMRTSTSWIEICYKFQHRRVQFDHIHQNMRHICKFVWKSASNFASSSSFSAWKMSKIEDFMGFGDQFWPCQLHQMRYIDNLTTAVWLLITCTRMCKIYPFMSRN